MQVPHFMRSTRYKQYFCSLSATLLTTSMYMFVIWPSPSIPLLTSPNSPIGVQLTKEEVSWVVSVKSLGMIPGAFLTGVLMDRFGRRKSLILGGLLLFLPWIIIILFASLPMLILSRALSGVGAALVSGTVSIYIGEISQKDIRGRLAAIPSLGTVIAAIVILAVGPFVSFMTLAFICAVPSTIFCATCYFLPESPYYLVKIKQREAAYEVLRTLSKTTNTGSWLSEIETTVEKDESCQLKIKHLFLERNYRKSLGFVLAVKTLQQFCGLYAINAYLQTIMQESKTSLSPETSSVIFAAIQIPCVFLSIYLVDKVGRRPLLVVSSAGCAVALIGEGIYFYLLDTQKVDLSSVYFLPLLCLILYFIMVSVGIVHLLYVISGELFTTNVKKVGGSLIAFYSGLLSFVSLKIFSPVAAAWGVYTMFWIFAGVCILGVFFGLFILPETKGKSFDEIQTMLLEKRKGVNVLTENVTTVNDC
ncbi:hypothetical protein RN001_014017 [Aquatica leii]|uniref:Major facilitator superfamily (MFS) profile domain-containing protein n=1 Tax=Aquatica leii TaxID=1421715 RepID=A0AAN7PSH2_9COLE|nr:hypothetical protein RN001_014017 [Aquatica leii]